MSNDIALKSFPVGNLISTATGKSDLFEIPIGGQITFIASGLEAGDYIYFEIADISGPQYGCGCDYRVVSPSQIEDVQELTKNGLPIRLDVNNTFLILDYPQGYRLRAVAVVPQSKQDVGEFPALYGRVTNTPHLTDSLRGL